jgi:hypothetical protein
LIRAVGNEGQESEDTDLNVKNPSGSSSKDSVEGYDNGLEWPKPSECSEAIEPVDPKCSSQVLSRQVKMGSKQPPPAWKGVEVVANAEKIGEDR